jgi:hypothetical protein
MSGKGCRHFSIMKDAHNEWLVPERARTLMPLGVLRRRSWAGAEEGGGRKKTQAVGNTTVVGGSPEGPCGFEPLPLRQASGFAGGR